MAMDEESQPREGEFANGSDKAAPTSPNDKDIGPIDDATDLAVEEPLESFNWDDLAGKYHGMIAEKEQEIEQVLDEYNQLQGLFEQWCRAGQDVEGERTFKRHKTQALYVRKEEEDLERRREHYVGVMDAFQKAMAMLK
ncbi:hypothetical protein CAC42_5629 [Sphaceloma murrayae]|uniref:Uncharacterized protein n=1 Tax=Sphaceloma murrayae TaxID=2082308 RepID=A0A2K1QYS7_9PEZI|nr:hypothetical protein CAC42_5629 [Sphaceloma murrayae]